MVYLSLDKNHIHCKVWDEIAYPFPNFNGATVEVWEWISNFTPLFTGHVISYPWIIHVISNHWNGKVNFCGYYFTVCASCILCLLWTIMLNKTESESHKVYGNRQPKHNKHKKPVLLWKSWQKLALVNKDGFQTRLWFVGGYVSSHSESRSRVWTFLSSLMCIDIILANKSLGCYADCGPREYWQS